MKKFISLFIVLTLILEVGVCFGNEVNKPKLYFMGEKCEDYALENYYGDVMFSVRTIFERLGAEVVWLEETDDVMVKFPDKTYMFEIWDEDESNYFTLLIVDYEHYLNKSEEEQGISVLELLYFETSSRNNALTINDRTYLDPRSAVGLFNLFGYVLTQNGIDVMADKATSIPEITEDYRLKDEEIIGISRLSVNDNMAKVIETIGKPLVTDITVQGEAIIRYVGDLSYERRKDFYLYETYSQIYFKVYVNEDNSYSKIVEYPELFTLYDVTINIEYKSGGFKNRIEYSLIP